MKTKKQIVTKKYFDGGDFNQNITGLTANVNQALLSISAQQQANRLAEEQRRQQEKNALNTAKQEDTLLLGEHQSDGIVGAEYYNKLGGGISPSYSAKGGKLNPISSDMEEVKGNTHAEGGVKLMKGGQSTPFAEVEDKETIKDGTKVYSEFLKSSNGLSYAENAKNLATEKGELEKNLNKGDGMSNNTVKRRIGIVDSKEDILYKEQEMSKVPATTSSSFALGGGLNSFTPYIDNLVNGILTATTPKLQSPVYTKARELDTDVNVSSQIGDVNEAVDANTKTILENTSNSAAARNAITRTRLRGVSEKGKIRQYKENAESQLKNRNQFNKQQIDASNNYVRNNFNTQQVARQGAIQSRISENFSNLAGDFVDKRNFNEAKRYNNEQLSAIKSMYNNSNGVMDRADNRMLEEFLKLTKRG